MQLLIKNKIKISFFNFRNIHYEPKIINETTMQAIIFHNDIAQDINKEDRGIIIIIFSINETCIVTTQGPQPGL